VRNAARQDSGRVLPAGEGKPDPRDQFEVLTGAGPAAIAVVRLSGPGVAAFSGRHVRTRRPPQIASGSGQELASARIGDVLRATLVDEAGEVLDDILLSVHATGCGLELRLHLHGSPGLIGKVRRLLAGSGFAEHQARAWELFPAQDAVEAEAYHLLSRMLTLAGARWLIGNARRLSAQLRAVLGCDDLGVGREICQSLARRSAVFDWFARPARVVLLGPPNAGKSTLANALADEPVSLVSPVAGTTRDWIEVPCVMGGFPLVWVDTAGVCGKESGLEALAVGRLSSLLDEADGAVVVVDATTCQWRQVATIAQRCRVLAVAINKSDLVEDWQAAAHGLPAEWAERCCGVSALRGDGLRELGSVVLAALGRDERLLEEPAAFTARQIELLEAAAQAQDAAELREYVRKCVGPAPAC
jgi:tRNA modification GTPase